MEDDPMHVGKALQKLGVARPIFQAPIGSVASAELAAAVYEAGAIGHLACTWRSPDQLASLFTWMRARTAKPCGANFVLSFPIDEQLSVALDEGVPIISFFWGDGSATSPG
jgi:nitronate monooxygenase